MSLEKSSRFGSLDLVRLLAVCCVFGAHEIFRPFSPGLHQFWYKNDLGAYGVAVFFVISGFVVTRVLLRDKEDGIPLSNFILRRALRIMPIYYLYLLFITFFVKSSGTLGIPPLWSWLYLWNFFLPRWGAIYQCNILHTWTLSIEEQFYLLWPVIVFFMDRKKVCLMALGGIVFAIAYAVMAYAVGPLSARYLTSVQFLPLCSGSLLALNLGFPGKPAAKKLALALLIAGIAIHWLSFSWSVQHFPAGKYLPESCFADGHLASTLNMSGYLLELSRTAIGLSILLFCLGTVERQPWARRLRVGWLQDLGMMTYGIYLYHVYFFLKFGLIGGNATPVKALAAVLTTLLVTVISFHVIERPLIRLGKRLRKRAQERVKQGSKISLAESSVEAQDGSTPVAGVHH